MAAGSDQPMGVVTSGAPSPTLGMPIAMAYVPPPSAEVGTMVEIGIRGARVEADIVPLPFYKRSRA
jgi:aminomethyltransferase